MIKYQNEEHVCKFSKIYTASFWKTMRYKMYKKTTHCVYIVSLNVSLKKIKNKRVFR